jgi:hypothetical protein
LVDVLIERYQGDVSASSTESHIANCLAEAQFRRAGGPLQPFGRQKDKNVI